MIVLDLGQEVSNATSTPASSSLANTVMASTPSNNVLSDILQMTGIMGSEDDTIQEQQQQHETVHLQQPRLETKTLKKGEGLYLIVLLKKIIFNTHFYCNLRKVMT